MDPKDIIKALNRSLSLLADLKYVPSTHLTLSQMQVSDYQKRIEDSVKELIVVRETLKSDLDWDS